MQNLNKLKSLLKLVHMQQTTNNIYCQFTYIFSTRNLLSVARAAAYWSLSKPYMIKQNSDFTKD